MSDAKSDAFKIYFSIAVQPIFNNAKSESLKQKYEKIQELEQQKKVQLIPYASSLRYKSEAFRRNLARAVEIYCGYIVQKNTTLPRTARKNLDWANYSCDLMALCQSLQKYLEIRYKEWEAECIRSLMINAEFNKRKEKELIAQLTKIASIRCKANGETKGVLAHELCFEDEWVQGSNKYDACLIYANKESIQEWTIHRLYHFSKEIRSSQILPLNIHKYGRGFKQQLFNAVADHLLPDIEAEYTDGMVIDAILSRVQTQSMTFIFYGLDQVSVQEKKEIWKFWLKVNNKIHDKKFELLDTKIFALMPHSISTNYLHDKAFVKALAPFELIEPSFMESWMLDKDGNDVVDVRALFQASNASYEDEIKMSLLSAYESVEPLIRKINHYVTGCDNLENLRPHWSLAQ